MNDHLEPSARGSKPRSLLRLNHVLSQTGLARSVLQLLVAKQDFPRPIKLHGRAVAWDSEAVDRWIEARITASA